MNLHIPHPTTAADHELALLRVLSRQFPSVDSAMAEIARLSAVLTLPKGTVHVISDIHGEDKKLRHVINNASGTLRPLIEKLFAQRMGAAAVQGLSDADLLSRRGDRAARAHAVRPSGAAELRRAHPAVSVRAGAHAGHALQPPPRHGGLSARSIASCWPRCCTSPPPSGAGN